MGLSVLGLGVSLGPGVLRVLFVFASGRFDTGNPPV